MVPVAAYEFRCSNFVSFLHFRGEKIAFYPKEKSKNYKKKNNNDVKVMIVVGSNWYDFKYYKIIIIKIIINNVKVIY